MKNQKKWELLKYAYDNYPKGTKVKTLYDGEVAESSGIFVFSTNIWCNVGDLNKDFDIYDASSGKWAEIVKPKIAVRVENEKEFDALMKYYDSFGWKWYRGDNALDYRPKTPYPLVIDFCNRFKIYEGVVSNYKIDSGSKILPFSDFAKEHNIKLPMIKSEDGVWLYEGDANHVVSNRDGSWGYICHNSTISNDHNVVENPESYKAFITQQAALDWIEAQKPKEIKVKLFGNKKAFICKDKITIDDGKYTFDLFPSDLEDINHYFKELS